MEPLENIILQGDFAENFSHIIQDVVQSFHWESKQAIFILLWHTIDWLTELLNIEMFVLSVTPKEHNSTTVAFFENRHFIPPKSVS